MSIEDTIRQVVREENETLLDNIKLLLDSYGQKDQPKTLTVKEAANLLGFGVTKTYELIWQAEHTHFPYLKSGNRYVIPYQALMNWMNEQAKQVI